jgi:pSer/pThr/pTyr-binding forkhead associated (FHA) protein
MRYKNPRLKDPIRGGEEYNLPEGETFFGREQDLPKIGNTPFSILSRKHFVIYNNDGVVTIEDTNSTYGTHVIREDNIGLDEFFLEKRSNPLELRAGDEILAAPNVDKPNRPYNVSFLGELIQEDSEEKKTYEGPKCGLWDFEDPDNSFYPD